MIGEDFPQRIYDEIKQATHICYIISRNSVNSEWVKEELSTAKVVEKERKKTFIIPILILLRQINHSDFAQLLDITAVSTRKPP